MAKQLFHYIHHAAFVVETEGHRAIFDPFLEGNPEGLTARSIEAEWIFVTHAHGDHLGSAYEIAQQSGACIVTTAEIAAQAREAGCTAHAMHVGGTHRFEFGKVRLTPAFHGSGIAGGHACGFIVDFYGIRLYYAGDTGIFGDMALLQRLDAFDVAVLPIGGNFTMDPADAALACEWLKAPIVIPVHYNTWPVIAQDSDAFKKLVEERTSSRVFVVRPGSTVELPLAS